MRQTAFKMSFQATRLDRDPNPPDPRLRVLEPDEARELLRAAGRTKGFVFPAAIAFPVRLKWKVPRLVGARFVDSSLRGAFISRWPMKTVFEECVFEDTELDGPYARKVTFGKCRFLRTSLGKKMMAVLVNCIASDCTFDEFDFGDGQALKSRFIDCNFTATRTAGFTFRGCSFENCRWAGSLRRTSFISCGFLNCDFTELRFDDCAIIACRRVSLSLPKNTTELDVIA